MQFLRSVLGAGGPTKELPYNIGEPYGEAWGSWTHCQGTSKEDGSPVSIFSLTGSNAQDARLAPARNCVKRLRTVRHPNVLSFITSMEIEKEEAGAQKTTIYVVTEPVAPLSAKIKELQLKGTQRDEYFALGLLQIAKAVSFLSNDCKLVHGNVCLASVVVTPSLDWRLYAFDALSEFEGMKEGVDPSTPMLPFEWMVGAQYKPMEVAKSDWPAVRRGPPYAIDAWGLGCLIHELFSGSRLSRTEELRNTAGIPKTLLPDYQRLLGSIPSRRMNPSKLIDNSEFFQNKLVDTIQFMEVLNLKDSVEKDSFFRKLPTLTDQLPRNIVVKKILPQLASALEFGSAPSVGLNLLLKIGSWLPKDEFNAKLLPTIIKLFSSTDRSIRVALLQHMESFGESFSPAVIEDQIFPSVATGFSDSSAFLRELTLKCMLVLSPKLSQRTLGGPFLKHLSKLQVDEEPAIRTNTTILLGNIARHLNDSTRKRVLVNAFTVRALRDNFPPARAAGIMALMATKEYYDVTEIATRILPPMVVLTVDSDVDVRTKACQGSEQFLQLIKEHYAQLAAGASAEDGEAAESAGAAAASSGLLGWAVSSLTTSGKPAAPGGTAAPLPTPSPAAGAPAAADTGSSSSAAAPSTSASTAEPPESDGWGMDNGEDEEEEEPFSPVKPAARSTPAAHTSSFSAGGGYGRSAVPAASVIQSSEREAEEDDGDGWDDLESEETAAAASAASSSLSRIQAAQQRPVVSAPKAPTTLSSSAKPSAPSSGLRMSGSVSKPTTAAATRTAAGGGLRLTGKTASSTTNSKASSSVGSDNDDPWASIAAPAPVSAAKPLSSAGRGGAAAAARSGAGAAATGGSHVRLPAQAQHVSLDSMLGAEGKGKGKAGPLRLGAQRVQK